MKQSGVSVSPGQLVQVAVTPSMTSTTHSTKRRFTPTERSCYFSDEVTLQHFPVDRDYRFLKTRSLNMQNQPFWYPLDMR